MIYRFGKFTVDSANYELKLASAPVSIEPKVFNLLLHLIENRDRVVSKDDLISAVWEGRAISDTTLSSGIFALRRALGDNGGTQTVVRTVPRRGFRFVADVTLEPEDCARDNAEVEDGKPVTRAPDLSTINDILAGNTPANQIRKYQATALPTLVVLPFRIASAGLDEYFCDGLTEDIISNLTHFSELKVIASGSSFQFRNRALTLMETALELNADYVVSGSVRRAGDRLRVAVQLIEAATGVSLWADRYDRQIEDIFAVQDAVTHMIAASLGVKMQNAELTRALAKSPAEFDAYDCLLHARRYTSTLNDRMHKEARDLLEKAVMLDPNYGEAYALLANVYLAEHRFDANPRPDPVDRALKMALKATQLDPQNAYAHCWLAIVHFFRKDNAKFEAEAKRALDLNPNDPEILADIGHYLSFMGEFEQGIELSLRAQQLNPLHPGWYHFSFARLHYHQQKYEEMLVDVQRISMPNFYWTHLLDAAAMGQMGRREAPASITMMRDSKPGLSVTNELHKWNVAPHDFDHIMEGLRKAGLDE